MWFDSHCHVHLCETGTPAEVVERGRAAGVTRMLTVGIDVASSRVALELARTHGLFAAVGVHPNSATEWDAAALADISEMLDAPEVVAVGESGLDFYRDHAEPEQQHVAFRAHISLAKSAGKTLVIHTRASIDEALHVLETEGPPSRVIFHCWSGDSDQMKRAVELGAFISFAGNVSFKSAEDLRVVATQVPAERLLVETDSPFLTPVPNRGKPNEPRNVAFVGEAVAATRSVTTTEIAELTSANAATAFGL